MKEQMTAQQALEQYDNSQPVWSIEMGGIGQGYEQAIQTGVFEFLRWLLETKPKYTFGSSYTADEVETRDTALQDISKRFELHLSGAQAGAIMSLATAFYMKDYGACFAEVDKDRAILVDKRKTVAA